MAGERLAHLAAKLRAGGALDDWYYTRIPLREETLSELEVGGDVVAVITRNRYGAEILNTSRVLIADVDFPEPPKRVRRRLFGGRKERERQAEESIAAQDAAIERVHAFAAARPDLGVRSYLTAGGLRVFVTGVSGEPSGAEAQRVLGELGSDPIYVRLCTAHETYRARLTPKPWRVGQRYYDASWPFSREGEPELASRWVEEYRQASEAASVCVLLATTGPAPGQVEQAILDLHDAVTGVESELPLA